MTLFCDNAPNIMLFYNFSSQVVKSFHILSYGKRSGHGVCGGELWADGIEHGVFMCQVCLIEERGLQQSGECAEENEDSIEIAMDGCVFQGDAIEMEAL